MAFEFEFSSPDGTTTWSQVQDQWGVIGLFDEPTTPPERDVIVRLLEKACEACLTDGGVTSFSRHGPRHKRTTFHAGAQILKCRWDKKQIVDEFSVFEAVKMWMDAHGYKDVPWNWDYALYRDPETGESIPDFYVRAVSLTGTVEVDPVAKLKGSK